jgi:hypothetical protein
MLTLLDYFRFLFSPRKSAHVHTRGQARPYNARVVEKKIEQWLWSVEDGCYGKCMLTLVVRNPTIPNGEGDIIFSRDNLTEVAKAIEALVATQPAPRAS